MTLIQLKLKSATLLLNYLSVYYIHYYLIMIQKYATLHCVIFIFSVLLVSTLQHKAKLNSVFTALDLHATPPGTLIAVLIINTFSTLK